MPVVAHIIQEGVADGAGHISGHFSLVQSWRRPPASGADEIIDVDAVPFEKRYAANLQDEKVKVAAQRRSSAARGADDIIDAETWPGEVCGAQNRPHEHEKPEKQCRWPATSRADEGVESETLPGEIFGVENLPEHDVEVEPQCPETLLRRQEVGARAASAQWFEDTFAALDTTVATDVSVIPDTHRDAPSLVVEAGRIESWIASEQPDMDARVRHLALILLHVYKMRLISVWVREYVLLAHLVLGRGEPRLRAHDRITWVRHDDKDSWCMFEGVLPESVYTFVKLCLLQAEGLLRCLCKNVARNDSALLQVKHCESSHICTDQKCQTL